MVDALTADHLGKRYGRRRWALRDVCLTIPRGRVSALVGPNAAGKSTLIRMWAGLEAPTTGEVAVEGLDPWHNRARALRHVGYVSQHPALHRRLSIDDHLRLAVRLRPGFDSPGAAQRLAEVGIALKSRAGDLSGGQQAQVALAIAVSCRGSVLLMDEPLASLDPLARGELLNLVRRHVSDGATVLMSSHIVAELEGVCDWVVVLGVGRVLLEGPVEQILATHSIVTTADTPAEAGQIGEFLTPTGDRNVLLRHRRRERPTGIEGASLEDVVKGYLAAARAEKVSG